ncbi:MAG: hypothetical protein WC241_04590 [Candidatus Paceibacterota bacterium]|jgi:hypothetical protein
MDWQNIESARNTATTAAQTASDYSAAGNTLADELRKAVGERYAQSDIAKEAATNRSNYLVAAPQARADVLGLVKGGSILSPTQQNAILAAKRASAIAPLMGSNLMEQAAYGTMEDLINAGVNSWNAQTQALQGTANITQNSYTSMLNELLQKAQEERATASAGREAELFPIQKAQALATLAKMGQGTQTEKESSQRTDIAGYFTDIDLGNAVDNRNSAYNTAKILISKGYDPNLIYSVIDQMFPVTKEPSNNVSEWEAKQQVYQSAFNAKQKGADINKIKSYIQSQGFDPNDWSFSGLLY